MRSLFLYCAMLAALPTSAWSAEAADGQRRLDTLVVTGARSQSGYVSQSDSATRTGTPVLEVPGDVRVISRQLLEDIGASRFKDALQYTSGVALQNPFGGLWDNYSLQGFGINATFAGSTTNILVNGYMSNLGYHAPRDTSNIENIEVLYGPAAAAYGAGDPGGTINIVTKKPQFTRRTVVEAQARSYRRYRATVDTTGPITENVAFRLNGALEDGDSFRHYIHLSRQFIAPTLTWNLNSSTQINYDGQYLRQKVPLDRGVVAVNGKLGVVSRSVFLGEPGDGDITIENFTSQLSVSHTFSNAWSSRLGVSYTGGILRGFSSEPTAVTAGQTLTRNRRFRNYVDHTLAVQGEVVGKFETGSLTHQLAAGVDAYSFMISSIVNRRNPTAAAPYSINIFKPIYGQPLPTLLANTNTYERQNTAGFYAQDQIGITDRFKILAGVRYDVFRDQLRNRLTGLNTIERPTHTTPRVGATYLPSPNFSVYASYSKSFHLNTGVTTFNGLGLPPETGDAIEAGVKFESSDHLYGATFNLFDVNKRNSLSTDPANPAFTIAVGKAKSKGAQLDVSGQLMPDVRVSGALTYTNARVESDTTLLARTRLLNVPVWSGSVLVIKEFKLDSKQVIGVGAGAIYAGNRPGDATNGFKLPSYTTAKLTAYWRFDPRFQLTLDVDNVFDKTFYEASFNQVFVTPGAPRMFQLTARAAF